MIEFKPMLERLCDAGVDFIIIGGVAGALHGSSRSTRDLDVVYRRSAQNFQRLIAALRLVDPYPRDAPPGLPFNWDERTLRLGNNFTLQTSLGSMDLFGEIAGGGTFESLQPFTETAVIQDRPCRFLNIEKLIEVKRAAGRPRDFDAIAELQRIRDEPR